MNAIFSSVFSPTRKCHTHRDVENDLEVNGQLAKRIASATLSVLSLYSPIGTTVSLFSSGSRFLCSLNNCNELKAEKIGNLVLSIVAPVGSFYGSKYGMAITTSHDILQNVQRIGKLDAPEQKVLEVLKLMGNIAYMALLLRGTLELQITFLASQVLINLGSSIIDFKNDRYIEGATNLVVAGVRTKQVSGYVELWNRRKAIDEVIRNIFVDKMGKKGEFPSDHLPIGVEIDGEFEVISWNVMNNCYMGWVKKEDSQGLNGSLLTILDIPVDPDQPQGLTQRDQMIIGMLETITGKPKSGLIALQECGEPFLKALDESLPEGWHIARSFDGQHKLDQEVVLYNETYFSYKPNLSETPRDAYPSVQGRHLSQAVFERVNGGKLLRLFNAHIPGDPKASGPEEYANYVRRFTSEGITTVALGDCNFERGRMATAFEQAGLLSEEYPERVFHTPWPTNIHPGSESAKSFGPGAYTSKGIDHALILGAESRALSMPEVLNDDRFFRTVSHLQGKGSVL